MIDLSIAVPTIIALVSVCKVAGMPSRFAPILSVILGILAFHFAGEGETTINIIEGLIAGLTASGLYSGVKATLK